MTEKPTTTADTTTTDPTTAHAPSGFIPQPTAADWFGELEGIGADMPARDRYTVAGRVLRLAVDYQTTNQRTDYPAQTVERLGQIKARGGGIGFAQNGDVGIGGCLQTGQAAADDEEAQEEEMEGHHLFARDK